MRLAMQALPEDQLVGHRTLATLIGLIDGQIGEDEPGQASRGAVGAFLDVLGRADTNPDSLTPRDWAGLRSVFADHLKADPQPDERQTTRREYETVNPEWLGLGAEAAEFGSAPHSDGEC
jgi:hypothetical protein